MAQATGAIQPTAAAIRRTMLQQTQVGLLLACGLSGPLKHILWWRTSDSYDTISVLICASFFYLLTVASSDKCLALRCVSLAWLRL